MNDFWQFKESKQNIHEHNKNKKSVNIDSIKLVRKQSPTPLSPTKNKKNKFKVWFGATIFIILIIIFILSGFWVANASKNKLNLLKLFKDGKYLVLFQNNAEMRPTGGFIGSFAIVEFSNYKVKDINFNTNIYKLDQEYTSGHIILPPMPLAEVSNGKWALRDSNFAVSFPESAQKIEWFYNQETDEKVDGVIAINASVVKDLLTITGPINMPEYNTNISSDNFFNELSRQIEKDYYQVSNNRDANEPKTILKDLLPLLVSKVMQQGKIGLLQQIISEIEQKQILFYSNNQKIQQSILAENWGGEVKNTDSDFLEVNNANIGGGKSSIKVVESLDYKVKQNNNILEGNLIITRSHAGSYTWPDGINFNYIRVLVPYGSTLTSAQLNGKDNLKKTTTGEEAGKTYFALNTATAPGTSDVINLTYNLPISSRNYSLLVQKQPGNLGDKLTVKYDNQLLFDGLLDKDKYLSIK